MSRGTGISVLSALLTGAFCAVFAIFLNVVLPTMSVVFLLASAGTSGFLGSLFAQFIMRNRR